MYNKHPINGLVTMFFVDAIARTAEPISAPIDYESWLDMLHCRVIDITERRIGDRVYDIIIDDEGAFDMPYRVTGISRTGEPMLAGNLLVATTDGNGKTLGLDDDDVANITEQIENICMVWNTELFYPAIVMDYV